MYASMPRLGSHLQNKRHCGLDRGNVFPSFASLPVLLLRANTAIVSVSWFATSRQRPDRSTTRWRGFFPLHDDLSIIVSFPSFGDTEKVAKKSSNRLAT